MRTLVEELGLTGELRGVTDAEIQEIRRDQALPSLPGRYVEFLRTMGRDAGPLLRGTDAFYPAIIGLRQEAVNLLEENNVAGLVPDDAVIFAMHQGYQLYWMLGWAAADPPVRMYQEGDATWSQEWPSFTQFLLSELLS
jgi:SMI1/KNR4 family protein SUKH-1